jgi:hypothetical protein
VGNCFSPGGTELCLVDGYLILAHKTKKQIDESQNFEVVVYLMHVDSF